MATRNRSGPIELRARRVWLVIGWALVLLVIYLSLTPDPITLPVEQGDQYQHVLASFRLMSWFANVYATRVQRVRFAFGFIVLGIVLEFLQRWSGYRSFDVIDMAAGAVGVAAGWILAPPRLPNILYLMAGIAGREGSRSS